MVMNASICRSEYFTKYCSSMKKQYSNVVLLGCTMIKESDIISFTENIGTAFNIILISFQ